MNQTYFRCANCKKENKMFNKLCEHCGESTTVALLRIRPNGSAPEGFCWALYPWDSTLGSSVIDDVIIPNNKISKNHCSLVFGNDEKFHLTVSKRENRVHVGHDLVLRANPRRLTEGDIIRIADDELEIAYHKISLEEERMFTDQDRARRRTEKEHSTSPAATRLMLMQGYLQEVRSCTDIEELLSSAIDATLKITGMERGYGFIVEDHDDEMNLKEIVSRKVGEQAYFEKEYSISRSLITKVLEKNGSVIIEDGDVNVDTTHSMRGFKIKSVVCLPLTLFDKKTRETKLLGIIYADKTLSKAKMPPQISTTLQQLAQIVSNNILRCQEYETTVAANTQYENYIISLAEELDLIKGNVNLISEKLLEVENAADLELYQGYLNGESEKLENIVTTVREALS